VLPREPGRYIFVRETLSKAAGRNHGRRNTDNDYPIIAEGNYDQIASITLLTYDMIQNLGDEVPSPIIDVLVLSFWIGLSSFGERNGTLGRSCTLPRVIWLSWTRGP